MKKIFLLVVLLMAQVGQGAMWTCSLDCKVGNGSTVTSYGHSKNKDTAAWLAHLQCKELYYGVISSNVTCTSPAGGEQSAQEKY